MCCDRWVTNPASRPASSAADLRTIAEQLASEAAAFVRTRRAEVFGAAAESGQAAATAVSAVSSKSTPTDPVTVVDTETERLLRQRIATLRPSDLVVGEEGGGPSGDAQAGVVTWVLDPIDGTVNFVYGIPAYAVSVAAQVDGITVAGAVADVVAGEVYSAGLGLGAHVEGPAGRRQLHCTAVLTLSMTLLGTGFGYSPARRATQAALLAQLMPLVRDVRRVGSAALDLCMVAAGRLDAYYEHGTKVWDWAAGALVAAEAGAWVRLPQDTKDLLAAAAPGVADEFRETLGRFGGLAPLPE
ncbi:inositol monophosphatase family protein [Mycolicibacterium komossense]|uniref:inositol-phosphate phosphatase n=1 Tax=Mycolicibacterium komossense TaxID=1779 RepID=A0ABT3CHC1_9MYCO|nr:inositol monophosphatase family protein [Mycolicibacterium komossense]MCV7228900.1 inositol monophosphatase [Mycolicibacterium komossense]